MALVHPRHSTQLLEREPATMAKDKRWAENVPGGSGLVLRVGVDRPKNQSEWMVQFWIKKDDGQNRIGGHYILIPPDLIRAGLQDGEFAGIGDQGKLCYLYVNRSDTERTSLAKLYKERNYQRPEQSTTVDSVELRRVLAEAFRRLEEED
jgi:hypothetical protein